MRAHVHVRARAAAAMLAAMLAAGCHDLPDLGVCGNGIVEEANGEACDEGGPSETCTAGCTLQCMEMAKAPSSYALVDSINSLYCPDASYHCGTDLICRAPSGTFQAVSPPQAFDVNNAPVVGDVDNDGLVDLVGTSPTKIYTRFASTFGDPLGEVIVQDSPSSDAPYAIFDRDPGRRDPMQSNLEIAVPTEGVALLRSNGERFAPELELPLAVMGQAAGLVVRDPDPKLGDVVVTIQSQSATPTILVTRNEVKSPDMSTVVVQEQRLQDCVGAAGGAWRLLAFEAAPDRRSFVVVTQQVLGTAWHVCRYAQAGGSWTLAALDFAAGAPKTIALANLDTDACLELALRIDGTPGAFARLDAVEPDCALQPAVQPLPLLDAWPGPGPGQGLLAAGQIVDDGPDELVLEGGVYQACGVTALPCGGLAAGTYLRVAQPTKVPWHAAVTVDTNGDGALDVVAARGGEADVDIVRGGLIPNVYRASTSVPITSLVAGDFDGDRLGDAAMIEGTPAGDRIAILFGTREAIVGAPVTMSSPRGQLVLGRLSEIRWLPTKRGADGVDDLLVVDRSQASPEIGVAFGDAARIMTTPRFSPASVDGSLLRGVTAGRFVSPELGVQIVALTATQGLLYDVGAEMWMGQVPLPPGMSIGPPLASLRDRDAARGAARGPGNSVVVFSLRGMAITTCAPATTAGTPSGVRGVDIDGDGVDELAVQYDMGRQVQLFDIQAGEGAPCKLVSILEDVLADCVDLANAGTALVAICRGSPDAPANEVRLLTPMGPRSYVRSKPIAHVQGDGRFAAAGDFDGDGVLDVAIGARRVDAVAVQLLKQCPGHDTRGCLVPVAEQQPAP